MWIDADAMFTNHNKRIEELLPLMSDKECMLMTEDPHGINCGVLIFKNNRDALNLLDDIWSCKDHHNSELWEQDALEDIMPTVKHKIKVIPNSDRSLFNAYDDSWVEGDFIVHFAGVKGDKLIDNQKKYNTMTL
jgi:hypothetical protein